MKALIILLTALSLQGCVSLPWNPFSSDKGLSVDAQVGKTNEKVNGVKADEVALVSKKNTAEFIVEDSKVGTITGGEVTIEENVPLWVWILVILGWVLPSPSEIWRGLGKLMYDIRDFVRGN